MSIKSVCRVDWINFCLAWQHCQLIVQLIRKLTIMQKACVGPSSHGDVSGMICITVHKICVSCAQHHLVATVVSLVKNKMIIRKCSFWHADGSCNLYCVLALHMAIHREEGEGKRSQHLPTLYKRQYFSNCINWCTQYNHIAIAKVYMHFTILLQKRHHSQQKRGEKCFWFHGTLSFLLPNTTSRVTIGTRTS